MRNRLLLLIFTLAFANFLTAQTVQEMTAQKVQKEKELASLKPQAEEMAKQVEALEADIAGLVDKITPYPRWDVGALGTIGVNSANFSDWLSKDKPSTSSTSIGVSASVYANLDQEKYFWRNTAGLNLGWIKFQDKSQIQQNDFEVAADALNIVSLLGYKLNDKWALSGLAEYRSAVLDGKFNNPGFLDIGVGVTWTPITNLVVVIHPLNYNFVFSDGAYDFQSSLGAKIVADYTAEIIPGLAWKSNLSAFVSYKDPNELSNWTWVNGLSTAVNGVGIGVEIGLRNNKQEARALDLSDSNGAFVNPLQTYWVVGLSYGLSTAK